MSDLPELPEPIKRKLALQWNTLLDKHGLAGEHLHWHASERERLRRVAAQMGPAPSQRWRGIDLGEQAVDGVGIAASVKVAEERFGGLSAEYWRRWLSSSDGYEVFAAWLDILRRQTSEEVASVWKGGSKAVDRWYKRACGPAVEDALTTQVDNWRRRALADELKRLERSAVEVTLPKSNNAGARAPRGSESAQTEVRPPEPESTASGRKRGRPQTIPDERKAKAVALKMSGSTNREVAAALYDKRHPSSQEVRNVHSILRAYSKKSNGPARPKRPRTQG
jgi:hypothetical protein